MNPQLDPHIIHIMQDAFPQTLCGLMEEDLNRWDLRRGERFYQCSGCLTVANGRPPVPPAEWFAWNAVTTSVTTEPPPESTTDS